MREEGCPPRETPGLTNPCPAAAADFPPMQPTPEELVARAVAPFAAADFPPMQPTPEELVARAVAPFKAAFLRPPPVRDTPTNEESRASGAVPLEKKSKRQFRRERKQVPLDARVEPHRSVDDWMKLTGGGDLHGPAVSDL